MTRDPASPSPTKTLPGNLFTALSTSQLLSTLETTEKTRNTTQRLLEGLLLRLDGWLVAWGIRWRLQLGGSIFEGTFGEKRRGEGFSGRMAWGGGIL